MRAGQMSGHLLTVAGALLAATCSAPPQSSPPAAAAPPTIGLGTVTRVGVVVRDAEAAGRTFERLLGVPVAPAAPRSRQLPDGTTVELTVVSIPLPNTEIELAQPVTPRGPWHSHLATYGQGIQFVEFGITDVDGLRARLQSKGGIWTAGVAGGDYAFVDFGNTLGATIAVANDRAKGRSSGETGTPLDPTKLGAIPLGQVSIAVRDYDAAAKALANVLDIEPRQGQRVPIVLPPGHPWNPHTSVDVAMLQVQNTGIELVEPVAAPSPWSIWIDQKGRNALHHIGFNVDTIEQTSRSVQFLQRNGGTWTVGGLSNFYGYVDFSDALGLTIEIVSRGR